MFSNVLKQVFGGGGRGGVKEACFRNHLKAYIGQTVGQEENVICNSRMSKFPFHICGSCKAEDFLAGAWACCCFR